VFNGSNVGEKIDISANGGRTRLSRDVGNVTMVSMVSSTSNSPPWAAPTTSWSTI
jgi:hypothetical protein